MKFNIRGGDQHTTKQQATITRVFTVFLWARSNICTWAFPWVLFACKDLKFMLDAKVQMILKLQYIITNNGIKYLTEMPTKPATLLHCLLGQTFLAHLPSTTWKMVLQLYSWDEEARNYFMYCVCVVNHCFWKLALSTYCLLGFAFHIQPPSWKLSFWGSKKFWSWPCATKGVPVPHTWHEKWNWHISQSKQLSLSEKLYPAFDLCMTYLSTLRQTKFNVDEEKGPQIRKWDFHILHSKFPSHVSDEGCLHWFSNPYKTINMAAENKSIALWKKSKQFGLHQMWHDMLPWERATIGWYQEVRFADEENRKICLYPTWFIINLFCTFVLIFLSLPSTTRVKKFDRIPVEPIIIFNGFVNEENQSTLDLECADTFLPGISSIGLIVEEILLFSGAFSNIIPFSSV